LFEHIKDIVYNFLDRVDCACITACFTVVMIFVRNAKNKLINGTDIDKTRYL